MSDDRVPFNQERDPGWNTEPGIVRTPESNYSREIAKFEQFPTAWTGQKGPGNPYVKREYPKMLYRAERYEGRIACMAAPPDHTSFADPRAYERADEAARKFTEKCQRTVYSPEERQRAMENNWREGPTEAVEALKAKEGAVSTDTAHRNYEDRNMGEPAKREIAAAVAEVGGEHVPEIPRKRGRPRKNPNPPAA